MTRTLNRLLAVVWGAVAILGALVVCYDARANPPDGLIDPKIHAWFDSLVRAFDWPNGTTTFGKCCAEADCLPESIRIDGDTLFVKNLGNPKLGEWVPVNDTNAIVRRDDNPIGRSIVCRYPTKTSIRCVIPFSGM